MLPKILRPQVSFPTGLKSPSIRISFLKEITFHIFVLVEKRWNVLSTLLLTLSWLHQESRNIALAWVQVVKILQRWWDRRHMEQYPSVGFQRGAEGGQVQGAGQGAWWWPALWGRGLAHVVLLAGSCWGLVSNLRSIGAAGVNPSLLSLDKSDKRKRPCHTHRQSGNSNLERGRFLTLGNPWRDCPMVYAK